MKQQLFNTSIQALKRPRTSLRFSTAAVHPQMQQQHPQQQHRLETDKDKLNATLADYNQQTSAFARDPLSVLRWASRVFDGQIAMSTSFGIQSSVLLHLATQVMPNIPIVWVDTGYLPVETYHYAEELKALLGLNLIVKTNDHMTPARMEALYGKLWEREDAQGHNLYGRLRKVEPLNAGLNAISPSPLALLSGLRASQTKARAGMPQIGFQAGRFKILPILHMTDADVEQYMDLHDLPRHPLQSKGYVSVGDAHSSRPLREGEDGRETRFGGKFQECGLHASETDDVEKVESVKDDKVHAVGSYSATGVQALESVTADDEETEMAVIMVKKINEDGSTCRKCNDVAAKLDKDDVRKWISEYVFADLRDPSSDGMKLAKHFDVATAPFFLVRSAKEQRENAEWRVVRSYLQLKKLLQDSAEKVLAEKEALRGMRDSEEFKEAERHVKELQLHVERLASEQAAARKKLEDTRKFFSSKFKVSEDVQPVF